MDRATALGDHVADGLAGAGTAVEDTGVVGEVGEEALDQSVEAGIVAEVVFVLFAKVVVEKLGAIGGT